MFSFYLDGLKNKPVDNIKVAVGYLRYVSEGGGHVLNLCLDVGLPKIEDRK